MPVERRGQVTDVGSEPTGNRRSSNSRREAAAFVRWHEPDDARVSSPDLWAARGETPRADSAWVARFCGIRAGCSPRRRLSARPCRWSPAGTSMWIEAGRGVGLEDGGRRLLRGQAGGQAVVLEAA